MSLISTSISLIMSVKLVPILLIFLIFSSIVWKLYHVLIKSTVIVSKGVLPWTTIESESRSTAWFKGFVSFRDALLQCCIVCWCGFLPLSCHFSCHFLYSLCIDCPVVGTWWVFLLCKLIHRKCRFKLIVTGHWLTVFLKKYGDC